MRYYRWPGNLRELRNIIERAVIFAGDGQVELAHLPEVFGVKGVTRRLEIGSPVTLAEIEDEHIRRVLARTPRLDEAAEILGVDRTTLYRRRREWENLC